VVAVGSKVRVQWIDINHKDVLFMDYAGATVAESLEMIAHYEHAVAGRLAAS
jgi:hypothetical protein